MTRSTRRARPQPLRRFAPAFMAALAPLLLGACSSYTLRGKVIEGDVSYVAVVDREDARLEGDGVAGAVVTLQSDPDKLSREMVGEAVTDGEGNFSIPIRKVGAGFLIYDVGLEARAKGYTGASHVFRLPPGGRRVLVMLEAGPNALPERDDDPYEQYKRFR